MTLKPFKYQKQASKMMIHLPGSALFADPGMGKTRAVLMAYKALKKMNPLFCGLVVAPLKPLYATWPEEIKKWAPRLTWSMVHGTQKQKLQALQTDADIYLTNPESLPWLKKQLGHVQFNAVTFDESTKYKGLGALWRAAKAIAKRAVKVIILSGTPVPNSYIEIFPQIYLIDREVLGENLEQFRGEYCKSVGRLEWNQWEVRPEAEEKILERIAPMTLRLDAKDHRDLPPLVYNDIKLGLPKKLMKSYKKLEEEMLLELEGLDVVPAWNTMHKYHFVRQFASGMVQHDNPNPEGIFRTILQEVHGVKAKALEALLEELGAKQLIVGYHYQTELTQLKELFGPIQDKVDHIGKATKDRTAEVVDWFNTGKIQILLCQIHSASLGLNLHLGGCRDICFFGQTDSPEDNQQFIGRIYGRTGVNEPVRVHRLVVKDTIEEVINARLATKQSKQQSLLDTLKAYNAVSN
jgi:SNF2 family DNA or RNA helicase